ncbi:hypothetical protein COV19_07725 [Candidatus Woesearchaeota archaeon CG10_big_fil_rev_8_21_14_0_10_44_13]|nr:MAG: hypothetical protein COV19_07725 [Candidatus Woesearchaeota archaeon CG10_big_fil_rev_8_21_14_0_10_44_13]
MAIRFLSGIFDSYDIDPGKFSEAREKIMLDRSRCHTDGLCCFFSKDDKKPGSIKTVKKEVILVRAWAAKPCPTEPIEEIVEQGFYHFDKYYPCRQLDVGYSINDGKLVIKAGCNLHEKGEKPGLCREFPLLTLPCHFEHYARSPAEQVRIGGPVHLYLYAFQEQDHGDLRQFSAGEAKLLSESYKSRILIPVPMKMYCRRE